MEVTRNLDVRGISKVYVTEKVQYKRDDLTEYLEIFNDLTKYEYIIADNFDDKLWVFPDTPSNEFLPLKFDLDIYPELQDGLKMIMLLLLSNGRATSWLHNFYIGLKKMIFISEGFTNVEALSIFLMKQGNPYFYARSILKFLDFFPISNSHEYTEICLKINEKERKNRDLPPFTDIFVFDEIINDYFRKTDFLEHMQFKPIQIWWALTTILPMRPNEFLRLKSDCVSSSKDGTYWITLLRSKKKKESIKDQIPTQTFQISKEIYDLVNNFQLEFTRIYGAHVFLFPQTLLQKTNLFPEIRKKKVVENRFTTSQFLNLLKKFHQRIVKEHYMENHLTEVLPIHSRHLAIINLFLQGFNLLSIAKMAGHDELNSPSNYYSHAENFVDSYVYTLVNLGLSDTIGRKMSAGFIGWRREIYNRGKLYSSQEAMEKFERVDYGFCSDIEDFPNNCSEDCRTCNFYIFKPSLNDYDKGVKWLESYSKDISQQISTIIKSMINMNKSTQFSPRTDVDVLLKSKSRELQKLMDHRVFVEMKMMEADFIE